MVKRSASSEPEALVARPRKQLGSAVNAEFLDRIQTCLMEILRHPLFQDIQDEMPLGQASGGREAALDPVTMSAALSSAGLLCLIIHARLVAILRIFCWQRLLPRSGKAGGNLFWINFSLDPIIVHTPIRKSQCERLADTHFKSPNYLPSDIVIAATMVKDKKHPAY